MVRKWAIIVLWGAVELFSDKHQRSNVLLCRGTGIYGDIGTGPHKFWQIVHLAESGFFFLDFYYLLSLKFQKATSKIEVFLALLAVSAKLRQPTGQSQENFNFDPRLLKF